ncbi:MAG: sigma-70 family RNA polymerase sigma factor [Coriobacteriales bacterium]|jgi:RNA polymerase sigma factor (sigma-70 family)|nr:sigma-70 family RNA polymerase sigma factor [Coriobacteriales bacterium]
MTTEQDIRLVKAAQAGNQKAFEALARMYYNKAFVLARTTLGDVASAEDAVQNALVVVWQQLSSLKEPAAFAGWLNRIVVNVCYDQLRQTRRVLPTEDDAPVFAELEENDIETIPAAYVERADLRERLGAVIASLGVQQRQALALFYYEQFSLEEIATITDSSVNTVKQRLFQARKAIATRIKAEEERTGERFYGVGGLALVALGPAMSGQFALQGLREAGIAQALASVLGEVSHLGATGLVSAADNALTASFGSGGTGAATGSKSALDTAGGSADMAGTAPSVARGAAAGKMSVAVKVLLALACVVVLASGGVIAAKVAGLLDPPPTPPIPEPNDDPVDTEVIVQPTVPPEIDDLVVFGNYGGRDIEWRVLDIQGNKAMIISEYAIDLREYHEKYEEVTWETCALRQWINDDFMSLAFDEQERQAIALTHLQNPDNAEFGTPGGNETDDYLYLLSTDEVYRFYPEAEDRIVTVRMSRPLMDDAVTRMDTQASRYGYLISHAQAFDEVQSLNGSPCMWWLRSPGGKSMFATFVFGGNGSLILGAGAEFVAPDFDTDLHDFGVRPVCWVALDELEPMQSEVELYPVEGETIGDFLFRPNYVDAEGVVVITADDVVTPDIIRSIEEDFFSFDEGEYAYRVEFGEFSEGLASVSITSFSLDSSGSIENVVGDAGGGIFIGYIDTSGTWVIKPMRLMASGSFHDGLAAAHAWWEEEFPSVHDIGGWGYIDREGNWAIEPRFAEVSDFSEGYARVWLDAGNDARMDPGETGYIDASGNWFIRLEN